MKKYKIKDIYTKEIYEWTLSEILENINRDRSDSWSNYDENDWEEGLEVFTEFELIGEVK